MNSLRMEPGRGTGTPGGNTRTTDATWWTIQRGASPVVGTAIHDGHALPPALAEIIAITPGERLREEDPCTEVFIRDVPNRVVMHQSRFAVDLNRARDAAIYLTPEQCWGMQAFARPPEPALMRELLRIHDDYYTALRGFLGQIEAQYGRFVLLDVHSYNHRRAGPEAPAAGAELAPQVNIGTFSMDRARWAHVVDPVIDRLRVFEFRGAPVDVRENVAFQGRGEQTRFVHTTFPQTGCAIAVEFKKVFMDEWTGKADPEALDAIRAMVGAMVPLIEDILGTPR